MRTPVTNKSGGGCRQQGSVWAEFLVPDSARGLAWYDHPFFGKYPGVTRNAFGKGMLTYEGTFLSDELQEKLVPDVLKASGRTSTDQQLPKSVRVVHGGHAMHYYLNYSREPNTFAYTYGEGMELLSGRGYAR